MAQGVPSLDKLIAQREKIQARIDARKSEQRGLILERVRHWVAEFGFTHKETHGKLDAVEPAAESASKPGWTEERRQQMRARGQQVKYRDADGNEWNGLRARPRWVVAYLKKRGHKLADLLTDEFREK